MFDRVIGMSFPINRIGFLSCLVLMQFGLVLRWNAFAEENEIRVASVSSAPAIDGVLDDAAWQEPPLDLGEWRTYNPLYGETMVQRTEIWVRYNESNLYFAFRCFDPEPDKIKTSVSRRDTIFSDDWVGISLDSMGNGQNAYEMLVNPSGVQADAIYSTSSNEDTAPDWVWESSGRQTEEGYSVELRLPFKSIRFKSGKDVRMGIIFFRRVGRLGMSSSWPHLPPGQSWLVLHAPLLLKNVEQPLILEAIPNITYSLNQNRTSPYDWSSENSEWNAGLTVKYGINSSITLDGTINPDFSQVESDAFQVEVNQRYPIFYNEKRPFFMEGMETFELAGSGYNGNMRTAVHTRRIIDPLYGLKLTGTLGRVTFATLSASDRAPINSNLEIPQTQERKEFHISRAFYSLGKGGYMGGLFEDTEYAGGHNRVMAGDISMQMGEHHRWNATLINSWTLFPNEGYGRSGAAAQISYQYGTKRYVVQTQLEHYDKNFQMDTAFYNRTGFTSEWLFSAINLYPDTERYSWFKRFMPFIFARYGRDRLQGGVDSFALAGVQMSFTRQGFLRIDTAVGREPWAGQEFFVRRTFVYGRTQLLKWLNIEARLNFSRSIFYDPQQPFSGRARSYYAGVTVQPSTKFSQNISYNHETFSSITSGTRVYTVNIINTKTIYQFNRRLFARAIIQYDSSLARVLTDFVGSYELVPGTVAYAGYGSILERRHWDGQQWIANHGDYVNTQRSLFFKVSYLYRF